MNTDKQEKSIKHLFVGKCWEYLNDNFYKFTDTNKIKVALALATKDMPQEIQGMSNQIIIMDKIKKSENRLEFKIGERTYSPQNTEHTEPATTDNHEV